VVQTWKVRLLTSSNASQRRSLMANLHCSPVHSKKSAEVIQREHESFKKQVVRALKIGKNPDANLANSKDAIERQISEIQGESLLVGQEVEGATKALESYQQGRLAGGKKAASSLQRRLNGFAHFVSAFDGLMEKIASAGSPYGEVGYQTLSILLIVSAAPTQVCTRP